MEWRKNRIAIGGVAFFVLLGLTLWAVNSRDRQPAGSGEVPSIELALDVRAAVDAQELHTDESTGVTYWEGAVVAMGTKDGQPVEGRGYLEMTGYAGAPLSEVLR